MIENLKECFLLGTVTAVLGYYLLMIVMAVEDPETDLIPVEIMLGIHIFSIVFLIILKNKDTVVFKNKFTHTHDREILEDNFTDSSKKSVLFQEAHQNFLSGQINKAFAILRNIEINYAQNTTLSEKAVLYFYIARCYDMMNYYPNADKYYTKAEENGFKNDILSLLKARICGNMGDTQEALEKYEKIYADVNNPVRVFVNVDLGRMFLKSDDSETALKYFNKAISNRECYADALAGASIANLFLGNMTEAYRLRKLAIANNLKDSVNFLHYFDSVLASRNTSINNVKR